MRSSPENLTRFSMDLHSFAQRIPKAELHIHLEGSIQPSTLLRLAERNEIDLPAKDIEGLGEFYQFEGFGQFMMVIFTITGCLRTPDDYQLLVEHFGFGAGELEQISLNGLRASNMPGVEKARLETEFKTEFVRLREELAGP